MKDFNKIKNQAKQRRVARVRSQISGTAQRPRLAIFKSLKHISLQAIDDLKGQTLAAASDIEVKEGSQKERARSVGKLIAKKLIEKKINQAVFDKRHYKYHGVIKEAAEGAREGGLKI
ncbi:MAG: 50S ribosomal protein L18 [Candidatus Komeilibacteria bacterium CG10_big_fil_rev_8_21_14_0_10_41_13]|uniref:Large ribosomal subunit protein uL18 n=1 Tax=Candidatus Komeilibacteria bacterium CG10_big_fil_rev_8_21_14_0_10_41_13 TaxID=1974476 RepID=A0A2M6WDH3_9BACT|nr:MAG: 50S ribosomal protein L18 [Candidatus Komeilibacteria bacterium CG10_big_fil_rev_8_21_14_0_10_41_13]